MEYRRKTASRIYKHLEDRVNCTNILEYIRTHSSESKKLVIDDILVNLEIIKYSDSTSDSDGSSASRNENGSLDLLLKKDLDKKYEIYDFISEANHTGFEYFPYLYGVLDCHSELNSKVYVLYEMFDGTLDTLFSELEQGSDWYEIIFQVCLINHYMINIAKVSYSDAIVPHHFYQKYKFPKKREYTLGDYKFEMYHKNLITLWDFKLEPESTHLPSNINHVLNYITSNTSKFKVQPSQRIIRMLSDITFDSTNIPKILDSYYNTKKEIKQETKQETKQDTTDTLHEEQ